MTYVREDAVATALAPEHWERANRELIAKMLTEFHYEEIITPVLSDNGDLTLALPDGTLTAHATQRELGWWRVDPESLAWRRDTGTPAALPEAAHVLASVLRAADVDSTTAAGVVSEVASTLLSDASQLATARPVASVVDLEAFQVDSELCGHPWIVANKGRVGFGGDDLFAYTPEARRDVHVLWVAADPSIADAASVPGLDHQTVVREQVGDTEFHRMRSTAESAGLDAESAIYLPVHPWQWDHKIVPLHAGEIARGRLVPLGQGAARYRPQLAIRTLTDVDDPNRRYLKLPVSILNTSVYRGLPRERTLVAPALTHWLSTLVGGDDFLHETGVVLLGEVASVSVAHPVYESLPGVPYQHTEMFGAIWREPVSPRLLPGERAMSLAALLHRDPAGRSLVEVLVERSGVEAATWVRKLHDAVLPPLLHVLYRYGAMFSPHGQNCMIVHRDGVPTRLVVKDFVDDLAICSERLPEHVGMELEVREALADVTLDAKALIKYLQNGLLICVYRYLAEIIESRLGLPESSFWAAARRTLSSYHERFNDELSDRYVLFDLETPTFPKLCLNRLRLFERGYSDDAERPVISAVGSVTNPLAPVD